MQHLGTGEGDIFVDTLVERHALSAANALLSFSPPLRPAFGNRVYQDMMKGTRPSDRVDLPWGVAEAGVLALLAAGGAAVGDGTAVVVFQNNLMQVDPQLRQGAAGLCRWHPERPYLSAVACGRRRAARLRLGALPGLWWLCDALGSGRRARGREELQR